MAWYGDPCVVCGSRPCQGNGFAIFREMICQRCLDWAGVILWGRAA